MQKIIIIYMVVLLCQMGCKSQEYDEAIYTKLREVMVKTQIISRGIKDKKVINAMLKVPRHKFVLDDMRARAYDDNPLPIGEGQTISQPYIVAFMTEQLKLTDTSCVLEIGTGSGYQAAILAEICKQVYTIEINKTLGKRAENTLKNLGYKNIKVKIADGYKGWKEFAPYDAIIVTCAPTHVPQNLIDQLAENGKIIIPVGSRFVQELVLLKKEQGKIVKKDVLPVIFVPMINNNGKKY